MQEGGADVLNPSSPRCFHESLSLVPSFCYKVNSMLRCSLLLLVLALDFSGNVGGGREGSDGAGSADGVPFRLSRCASDMPCPVLTLSSRATDTATYSYVTKAEWTSWGRTVLRLESVASSWSTCLWRRRARC
eukprot:1208679-Rhodomonas_salina.1